MNLLNPLGGNWSPNRRPVVANNSDGRLDVFMIGLDGQLYHKWQTSASDSSQWSAWDQLFGNRRFPTNAKPFLIRNADGRLEVFIAGSDEQIYHNWQILFGGKLQWNSINGIQL
jgi:hypothetical protein